MGEDEPGNTCPQLTAGLCFLQFPALLADGIAGFGYTGRFGFSKKFHKDLLERYWIVGIRKI
jgi:hypothetical protein